MTDVLVANADMQRSQCLSGAQILFSYSTNGHCQWSSENKKRGYSRLSRLLVVLALCTASVETVVGEEDSGKSAAIEHFETRIRPVLVEQCYKCHNSAKRADGGLAVDHRTAILEGGDTGPIIVPGKPAESRLLAILRHEVADLKMPKNGGKLDSSVVDDFQKWIAMGAPDRAIRPPRRRKSAQPRPGRLFFKRERSGGVFNPS